ncbi:hypothetical protein BU26DRAFT_440919, partial [Trematosphaeria pertusa]
APFTLHVEDFHLLSINNLHFGRKIWIVIPEASFDTLEQNLRQRIDREKGDICYQFVRHAPTYLPLNILKR